MQKLQFTLPSLVDASTLPKLGQLPGGYQPSPAHWQYPVGAGLQRCRAFLKGPAAQRVVIVEGESDEL